MAAVQATESVFAQTFIQEHLGGRGDIYFCFGSTDCDNNKQTQFSNSDNSNNQSRFRLKRQTVYTCATSSVYNVFLKDNQGYVINSFDCQHFANRNTDTVSRDESSQVQVGPMAEDRITDQLQRRPSVKKTSEALVFCYARFKFHLLCYTCMSVVLDARY